MRTKITLLSAFGLFITLISCGPAAEDRKAMHERAKVFQDSIATVIRTTVKEAEGPAPAPVVMPAPSPTPAPANK